MNIGQVLEPYWASAQPIDAVTAAQRLYIIDSDVCPLTEAFLEVVERVQ
jgi:hypothetical protein